MLTWIAICLLYPTIIFLAVMWFLAVTRLGDAERKIRQIETNIEEITALQKIRRIFPQRRTDS